MKKAFAVRPVHHNINRLQEFHLKNIVAIDQSGIGNLFGLSRKAIKDLLVSPPNNYTGRELGIADATVDLFVNQIQTGDLILVPDGDDIYFAEVTSGYIFNAADIEHGYPHQRTVRWLTRTSRSALSKELRSALRVNRIVADLSRHAEEIEAAATGNPVRPASAIDVSYPLRPNFLVNFKIPGDITKAEADRLSRHLSSLYFSG